MAERGFITLILHLDARGTAILSIERPLDGQVADELLWAFALLGADPRVKVIVLSPRAHVGAPAAALRDTDLAAVARAIDECCKPVIGRLESADRIAGLWLGSVCDVVLRTPRAHLVESAVAGALKTIAEGEGVVASNGAQALSPDRRATAANRTEAGPRSFPPARSMLLAS